jgi:hypothetical protein
VIEWLRKKSPVPERSFEPAALSYPFAFPIIETSADGMIVHRTPSEFGMIPENFAHEGRGPDTKVASTDGSLWRPKALLTVCRTGNRLFGQEFMWGEFSYERLDTWTLSELRSQATAIVDGDDDICNQVADHDTVLRAIRNSKSFGELVAAVADLGGQDR